MAEAEEEEPGNRIGLYGGSFNPPHVAHVLVLAWALASGEVDEIWVIPSGGHPFGKPLAPWQSRVEMCWRAFECFGERVSLLDIEKEERVHYSIDTVRELDKQAPGMEWRWIMGSDTQEEAAKWKEWEALMELAPPLVIPRAGYGEEASKGVFALPGISSTWVRECVAAGKVKEIKSVVPGAVLEYIFENKLYLGA